MNLSIRWRRWTWGLVWLYCATAHTTLVTAQPLTDDEETPWFRQSADNDKFALLITGAAASPEIRARFRRWSSDLYQSLRNDYGYAEDQITFLLDDGENTGNLRHQINGSSRVDDVRDAISDISEQAGEGDQITIFLIGHGSGTFGEAKFNNVGPDMTGTDFAAMLERLASQDLVVVNTTSAGFEFTRALASLGRVLISATRTSAERYDPVFGGYFVEALAAKRADLDRNERVSVLEAFNFARSQVAEWYREQGRLATEHAVLDDNGDGRFSTEPGRNQTDGILAEIAYLDMIHPEEQKSSPEAIELSDRMQELEREVFLLRSRKENYLQQDYWSRLEALLIELAVATRDYDALP